MKIRTKNKKYFIYTHKQWVFKNTPNRRHIGPIIIEVRNRG